MVSNGRSSRTETQSPTFTEEARATASTRRAFRSGRENERRVAFTVWLLSENRENLDRGCQTDS